MKKMIIFIIVIVCIVCYIAAKGQEDNIIYCKPGFIEPIRMGDNFILYAKNIDELIEQQEWNVEKLPILENIEYKHNFSEQELQSCLKSFIEDYQLGEHLDISKESGFYVAENEYYEIIMNDKKDITLTIKNSEKTGIEPKKNKHAYLNSINDLKKHYPQILGNSIYNLTCSYYGDELDATTEWIKEGSNDLETIINACKTKMRYYPFREKQDIFYFNHYNRQLKKSSCYKLKTKEEAMEDMKHGNYITYNKNVDVKNREVVYATISYQSVSNRYLYPCWKFYLKAEGKEGLQGFEEIYVPAVYEENLKKYRTEEGVLK